MRALTQQLDHAIQDCRVDCSIRRWEQIEGCRPPRQACGGYGLSLDLHPLLPFPGCSDLRSFALSCIPIYDLLPLHKPTATGKNSL